MSKYWHDSVKKMIDDQKSKGGLTVSSLKPGTKLVVETKNSFYEFEIVEGKKVKVFGGKLNDGLRFPKLTDAIINGSTWGGSFLKVDWIGEDMLLEIYANGKMITTSPVVNVTVESADAAWSYSMDWKKAQTTH